MIAKDLYERVCATLAGDTRKLWGKLQKTEDEIGVPRSTISRYYNGTREIQLKPLLEILCALDIEPAAFFARAFGRPLDAEVLLGDLIVDHRPANRVWREVETAICQLEVDGDLAPAGGAQARPRDVAALVADVAGASRREQMRRLRDTERYRHPDFARAYLRHLDTLREEDPDTTHRLVARVAIQLIPAIPGPIGERVELQCNALGVFGSAVRLRADFSTAARAFFLALRLADRHDLPEAKGALLHRIAHLLENTGNVDLALIALREAIEIYVHAGSKVGIGKTLVIQGRLFCCSDESERSIAVLNQALNLLPEDQTDLASYHFTAYQALADAYRQQRNMQKARVALAKASTFVLEHQHVRQGRLMWQVGEMSNDNGDFEDAEGLLQVSREQLWAQANPLQEALVSLDLIRSLLEQGKLEEAKDTASHTARFLEPFEGNPVAEGAILQLTRAAIEGRLSQAVVGEVRRGLEKARPGGRAR